MPRTRRQTPSPRNSPSDAHLDHLTTEVLRLRLDQLKLISTGPRRTLLDRLKGAIRDGLPNNQDTNQDQPPANDPEHPTLQQTEQSDSANIRPSDSFTPAQLNTLKGLITSTIQDALPLLMASPNAASTSVPDLLPDLQTVVNSVSPPDNALSNHLPAKVIGSIKNDHTNQQHHKDKPATPAATSIETSHAPPTHAHSSTVVTDPGATITTQLSTTMLKLQHLTIPNDHVDKYLSNHKPVTPINTVYLDKELSNHPNTSFRKNLLLGFRDGFRIGFQGPRISRFSKNLKSASEHPEIVAKNILTELSLRRTAGPFLSPPFYNFQVYPIGVVPKKNSTDWRMIFDLSHPKTAGNSVNAYISKEDYSLQYVRIDDAINLLIKLGKGSFMAKTDIRSAFRNVPVHPNDWELLGMHWKDLYFFHKVLPFGLRSAPHIFNQLLDGIEWIAKNNYNLNNILHILDDFFIVEPPPRSNCMTSLCKFLFLLTNLNVLIAHKKTCGFNQT